MRLVCDLPRRPVAILLAMLLVGVQLLVFPGAAQASSFPTPILDEPRVGGFEVTLEWTFDLDVVETPPQSTTVERRHPNGSTQSIKVDPPNATTFTDQLTDAGDYAYRIRATYRDDPRTIHQRSGWREVTVPGYPPDPPPRNGDGPLAPPENPQASLEVSAHSFGATVGLRGDAPAAALADESYPPPIPPPSLDPEIPEVPERPEEPEEPEVPTPTPAPAPVPVPSAGTEADGLPAQTTVEQQPAEVGEPQTRPGAGPVLDEEVEVAGVVDVAAQEPLAVGELVADVLSTLPGGTVVVTGDGCPPGGRVTASIDGVVVGSALAGADGRFEVEVVAPSIPGQFEVQIACGEVVRTVPIAVVLTTSTAGVGSSIVGTILAVFLLLSIAAWPRRSMWAADLP